MLKINWWAVIVAVIASVILAAVVYPPLSGVWAQSWGLDPTAAGSPAVGFFITLANSFFTALVMAALMARLGVQSLARGLAFGLLIGGGLLVSTVLTNYFFIRAGVVGALIDTAYITVRTAIIGIILGVWTKKA